MKNITLGICLICVHNMMAQNHQQMNMKIDTSSQSSMLNVDLFGEHIEISQKRIDSLTSIVLQKMNQILKDPATKQNLSKSFDQMSSKFEKMIDILLENKEQAHKAKVEIKLAMKDYQPQIDSAFNILQFQLKNNLGTRRTK